MSALKRTGYRRATYAPLPRASLGPIQPGAWRAGVTASKAVGPIKKRDYVRNKKLREAFRKIPCQNCGRDDGTVCCAHSNWSAHGKGAHIKADDSRGASLCAACHVPLLDQGAGLSRADRQRLWWDAHVKSVGLLVAMGAWPKAIPVPEVSIFPWEQA